MVVAVVVAVENVGKSLWLLHIFHRPLLPVQQKKTS